MERIPMTAAGYTALEDEINHLKTVERPATIRLIEEARARSFQPCFEATTIVAAELGADGVAIGSALLARDAAVSTGSGSDRA